MKRIHLLKTELRRSDLTDLLEALAELDLRAGWLDWLPQPELQRESHSEPQPSSAEGALLDMASAPILRAVAVESRRVTSIKPMAGDAVFRDVLRLHFRGCAVVLVRAATEAHPDELASAPELEVKDGKYVLTVTDEEGASKRLLWTAGELAARLRRPRPFVV